MSIDVTDSDADVTASRPYTAGSFKVKLHRFIEYARSITYLDEDMTPEQRKQKVADNLRFDQFCDGVRSIFGDDVKTQNLKSLYRKITMDPNTPIDWSEIFGYLEQGDSGDMTEEWGVFMVPAKRRIGNAAGSSKRRDIIVSIKFVSSLDSYLTISQRGVVCMWSNKLSLVWSMELNEQFWATGCDYLPNLRRIIACTERSLSIRDSRVTGKTQRAISIKPLENSPQCVAHVPRFSVEPQDTIIFGDDQGYINILTIFSKDVAVKTTNKNDSSIHVIEPKNLRSPIHRRKLHDGWVTRVKYLPDLHCFASSSQSSTSSFVMDEIDRLYDNSEVRGISITKGVNAFDYCAKANVIVTGGADKIIRVWHPHIYTRPTGKLVGHLFTIVDVTCNERDQQIISVCTGRIIRVWDIQTLTPLQIFTDNEERPGEKRIYAMMFDNSSERLLTGSSVLDSWPLTRAVQDSLQVPHSHDRPIVQALYNKTAGQVMSVCMEGSVHVWDMVTGKNMFTIGEGHGANLEVTAALVDAQGTRIVTGATDGSLKVWDFSAGQEWKELRGETDEDELGDNMSILGLQYCDIEGKRCLLVLGWNNALRLYLDADDNKELSLIKEFTGNASLHGLTSKNNNGSQDSSHISGAIQDRFITCITCNESNEAAIGCQSGEVFLFDLVLGNVISHISLPNTVEENKDFSVVGTKSVLAMKFISRQSEIANLESKPSVVNFADENNAVITPDNKIKTDIADENILSSRSVPDSLQKEKSENEIKKQQQNREKKSEDNKQQNVEQTSLQNREKKNEDKIEKQPNVDQASASQLKYILISCHQDCFIRLWDSKGVLLKTIAAITRRQNSPVTAVSYDETRHVLAVGDLKGYITLWDISSFLASPYFEEKDSVRQLASWRAHMYKIVQLDFVSTSDAIISASIDCSVRVWSSRAYSFIGFFGQHTPFSWTTPEEDTEHHIMPYDITEAPLMQFKTNEDEEQNDLICPLVVDTQKWQPHRHSVVPKILPKKPEPEDKKFFGALAKPKVRNDFLEGEKACDNYQEAVYRSLPIYRVRTPPKLKSPEHSFIMSDEEQLYLFDKNSESKEGFNRHQKISVHTLQGNNSRASRTTVTFEKTRRSTTNAPPNLKRGTVTPSPRKH